jgi:Fibronectin type III domain
MPGLLLALVVAAAPGLPTPSMAEEDAKQAFNEGKAAYDRGSLELAIKDFELAYQLSKRGEVLFAIARGYTDLKRWIDARDCYDKYLAEVPNGKSRARATDYLNEAEQKIRELGLQTSLARSLCRSALPTARPRTLPGPVSSVTVVARKDAADVAWTDADGKGSPVTGYTVKSIPPTGPGALNLGPVTSTIFPGLAPGTSYSFSVAASNANGEGLTTVSNAITLPEVRRSHPSGPAIVLGSVAIAATALAVVGIAEAASFKGWQGQPPGSTLQVSDVQSRVNSANTLATVALTSGIVAAAGLGGAILTW